MAARQKNSCTYPKFFKGAGGELIFMCRDGRSENGNQIYNVYGLKNRIWRLLDKPLTDGLGQIERVHFGVGARA